MAALPLSRPLLTIDDLTGMDLPEHWELIEGAIIPVSPTGGDSGRLTLKIGAILLLEGENTGLGWAFGGEAGFIIAADRQTVLAPDAAFVRRERMPNPRNTGFVPVAPDFVVEVLSPSDRYAAAVRKAGLYLEAGTMLVWLVDPVRRIVTVFQPDAPPVTFAGDAEMSADPVLPEMRVSLSTLFS